LLIRPAHPEDAPTLAALAGQLGYPTTPEEMMTRLQALAEDNYHAVFVAEQEGAVVGWIHVYLCLQVIAEREAEIGGLVVDEARRSRGIGTRLVREAEAWAQAHGCTALVVRSNVVREQAHAFYRRRGFQEVKLQRVFYKPLQEER
ncbi:MAG: GNAT family N-acetyltransferase, partial [Anaerolineae bacterium]